MAAMEEDNKPSREEPDNSIPLNLNLVLPTQIEEPINKAVDWGIFPTFIRERTTRTKLRMNLKCLCF